MLVFIPLLLVCSIGFTKNSFAQAFERNGNIVTYKGNKFELSKGSTDTMLMEDPSTKEERQIIVHTHPIVKKMNGNKLCSTDDVTTQPEPYAKDGPLEEYILKNLSDELNTLPDGSYTMDVSEIVFDNKGKVIFYQYGGFNKKEVPADFEKSIGEKIDRLLSSAPAMKPARLKGEVVAVRSNIMFNTYSIEVKNNKTSFKKTEGTLVHFK